MPNFNIKKILFKNFLKKSLASFYIIEHEGRSDSKKWAEELIALIMLEEKGNKSVSEVHPDVFYVNAKDQKLLMENIFFFNKHPPLKLSWKFFFIEDPHLISEISFAKLLKTLEEPVACSSIFFLHHLRQQFPKTVQGRAIVLKASHGQLQNSSLQSFWSREIGEDTIKDFERFFSNGDGIDDLFEKIKEANQETLIRFLLDWHLNTTHDGFASKRMIETLKHLHKARNYHHSFREYFCLLLHRMIQTPS